VDASDEIILWRGGLGEVELVGAANGVVQIASEVTTVTEESMDSLIQCVHSTAR
jgi:hypothetical protein